MSDWDTRHRDGHEPVQPTNEHGQTARDVLDETHALTAQGVSEDLGDPEDTHIEDSWEDLLAASGAPEEWAQGLVEATDLTLRGLHDGVAPDTRDLVALLEALRAAAGLVLTR